MKRALVRAATSRWIAPLLSHLVRGSGTVFMLHRFADRERGNTGHDPVLLRSHLAALRRSHRELVSVEEIVRRARENDFRGGAPVAFTVDDGYADFASVGAPIFTEFDCPVTVFLVSGVLDGHGWYWWDRISAAFEQASTRELTVDVAGQTLRLAWTSIEERGWAELAVMEAVKRVSDEERHRVLDALPSALGVAIPNQPSEKYAPMTWAQVREWGARGATFGAHTVTHPILSRVGSDAARAEIATSWDRLREETTATTKTFCYPNGKFNDFGTREIKILENLGFDSAVTTIPGHVTPASCALAPDAVYRISRFPYPYDDHDFGQITTGIERAKLAFRHAAAR